MTLCNVRFTCVLSPAPGCPPVVLAAVLLLLLACGDGATEPPPDPNRAPQPAGAIPPLVVGYSDSVTVDLAGYFRDPDGDPLTFAATSSDPGVAGAAVAGSVVTVGGMSRGMATITVTATDPGGLSARQAFEASVPNRGPEPVGTIAGRQIEVGDSITIGVSAHFADPEGDALAFSAVSSEPSVARAEVEGDSLRVVAVAKGAATVTVTAADPGGETADQSFAVTVPNRAPFVSDTIPAASVLLGDTIELRLAAYFADPDGDSLGFSAESSGPEVATAHVVGGELVVVPVAPGHATINVTASDPEGLSAAQSFPVTAAHPNRPPVAVGEILDRVIYVGTTDSLDVTPFFSDPDGDSLAYTVRTSRRIRVGVAVDGSVIALAALSIGSSTVTVTARDPDGLSATQRFRAVVEPVPAPDLVVDTATVDADSVEVGGAFTVTAVVRNQGEGRAGSGTTLRFFLSNNPAITATDSLLGTHPVEQLDAGASTAGSLTVYAPGAAGTYYYGACVEPLANESDNGNNCSRTVPVRAWQPNRGPVPVGEIPGLEVPHGDSSSLGLAVYFHDPDGDSLTFAAMSSAPGIAATNVTGSVVTLQAVSRGTATVTVTATDPAGLSARHQFEVTIPNRGPVALGEIADRSLSVGETDSLDISSHFSDPDGDSLAYTASTSDSVHVTVAADGSVIALAALSIGSSTITVTARDPHGLSATQRFRAVVEPVPAPDLVVDTATVDRDRVEIGGEFALNTVVRNRGSGGTLSSSTLRLFASPDSDITSDGTEITTHPVMPLAAGEASSISVRVTGPDSVTTLFYGVCVDALAAETDTGNNCSAGISVSFLEPNRAPQPVGTIRAHNLEPGNAIRIGLSSYFQDPDGDPLAFVAASSDTAVATTTVRRNSVTVNARALGTATITVTARDITTRPPGRLATTQQFDVTVRPRLRPDLVIEMLQDSFDIGPQQSFVGTAAVRNEGTLASTATMVRFYQSSDTVIDTADSQVGIATAGAVPQSGRQAVSVALTSHAETGVYYYGACVDAVVEESRTDNNCSGALTVVVDEVKPPNRAPTVSGGFRDITGAEPGERYRGPLDQVFSDPDGDPLTYAAESSDDAVARPEIVGDTIFVYTVAAGTATITVTATDPAGLSASTSFEVAVQAPCTGFCMQTGFTSAVSQAQRAAIGGGVAGWEAILANTELPDVTVPAGFSCAGLSIAEATVVDDHLFLAHVAPIDGPGGTLARAGFCAQRLGNGFPAVSRAVFDADDMDQLVSRGMLEDVAFHEVAHGLGFIHERLNSLGLLNTDGDPHFTGSGALAAFDAAGGTSYAGAKVPMSADLSHWRESVFDVEIMTPLLEIGVPQPVSAITLGAMSDMGYSVNFRLASDYTLPDSRPPVADAGQPRPVFDFSGDVDQGPVTVLGPEGRVVDVIPPPAAYDAPRRPFVQVTIDRRSPGGDGRPTGSRGPSVTGDPSTPVQVSWIREPYPAERSPEPPRRRSSQTGR